MDNISKHPLYRVHTIDSAISSLWDFYKRHFIPLFMISLVMALITKYVSSMIDFEELQTITDPQIMLVKIRDYIWPMMIISLLSLLFSTFMHYYIIYNPLDCENNVLRSSLKSLRYFIPYLIIMIFLAFFGSFVIVLGLVALIIGAFFAALYTMMIYFFILPVLMVEGPSIANAITRTIKLAHRNFWANMGWTAILILILLVISIIFSGLVLLPFTGNFINSITNPESTSVLSEVSANPLYIILTSIVSALTFPLLPLFACILYFNGRAREDQVLSEQNPNKDNEGNSGNEQKVSVEDLYAKPLDQSYEDNPGSAGPDTKN